MDKTNQLWCESQHYELWLKQQMSENQTTRQTYSFLDGLNEKQNKIPKDGDVAYVYTEIVYSTFIAHVV